MKLIKHFPLCPSEKGVGAGQHHLLGLALPTTLPEGSIFFGSSRKSVERGLDF